MQIYIFHKIIEFEIEPSDLVETVKTRVQEMEGIGSDQLRVIFQGKQLDDNKMLSDYNIQNDSTLMIGLRLK
jgi:hypothetical protein